MPDPLIYGGPSYPTVDTSNQPDWAGSGHPGGGQPIATIEEIIGAPVGFEAGSVDPGLAAGVVAESENIPYDEALNIVHQQPSGGSAGTGTAGTGATVYNPTGTSTPTTTQLIDESVGNMPPITGDNLTDEERRWNLNIALQNLWETGGGNIPGVSAPFGSTEHTSIGGINTNPYGVIYHTGGVDETTPGAVLLNQNDIINAINNGWNVPEQIWGQPVMSGLGQHFQEYPWSNEPGGIPMPTPEDIAAMGTSGPLLESLQDITTDYYRGREEQAWDPWADWDWNQGYYQPGQGMGAADSMSDLARNTWFSESLSDVEAREQARLDEGLGVATMGDMERMYGANFAADANPFFAPEFAQASLARGEADPMGDILYSQALWDVARA